MKLQFKEQQFQIQAVKAVVDCFAGQNRETNRFELEKSKDIIRKAKAAAVGDTQVQVAFETEVMESIGYRNKAFSITQSQILKNIQEVQQGNDLFQSEVIERPKGEKTSYNLTIEMETGTGKMKIIDNINKR